MKQITLILTSFLICLTANAQYAADTGKTPDRGIMVGGVGADGKYHFLLVDNAGALSLGAGSSGAVAQGSTTSGQSGQLMQGAVLTSPPTYTTAQTSPAVLTLKGALETAPIGAPNYANGQVATSTTAATLVAARVTRRSVSIKNYDATITVYIGAATVTAANGYKLLAGESVSIDATGLIQVIAASGTPTVGYFESYD